MKKRIKIDPAVLTVLLILLSMVIIVLVACLTANSKDGEKKTTEPPVITYPDIPEVPPRDEIKVTHSNKTADETYEKDGIEYVYSSVIYPYITGGIDAATSKINDAIFNFACERVAIKSFEKTNAEEAYERSKQDAMGFIEFEFITRVESVYVKDGYLSLMFRRVRTVGINEPSEDITTMCFDLVSGDEVDISVFMNINEASAATFLHDVLSQHININQDLFYADALSTLPDIIDLKSFYLKEEGLVLYFNPDIITPSVIGICDLTIQYDKIGH